MKSDLHNDSKQVIILDNKSLETIPPQEKWEFYNPQLKLRYKILSLLIICATIVISFKILSQPLDKFLEILPFIIIGGCSFIIFLVGAYHIKKFYSKMHDIIDANPLITWEEFKNGREEIFSPIIKSSISKYELERYLENKESFSYYIEKEFPYILLMGKGKNQLRQYYQKEWYLFKYGISKYQEQIEGAIRSGLRPKKFIEFIFWWKNFKPYSIIDYKEDESLFVNLLEDHFFVILRRYKRQTELFQSFLSDDKKSYNSGIDDIVDKECYAYFKYGKGDYSYIIKNYFDEHPELELNEKNFKKVFKENFQEFYRKFQLLKSVDERYGNYS